MITFQKQLNLNLCQETKQLAVRVQKSQPLFTPVTAELGKASDLKANSMRLLHISERKECK